MDDHWLQKLYLDHRRDFLLVAMGIVRRLETAEDIVHGAMVRLALLQAPPDHPRLYAIQTIRNRAIDFLRRQPLEFPSSDVESFAEPPAQNPEEDSDDQGNSRSALIQDAIEQLDHGSQEVIRLHLQLGLTFREIAETTGEPLQTVASRYRRAIQRLKTKLEICKDG